MESAADEVERGAGSEDSERLERDLSALGSLGEEHPGSRRKPLWRESLEWVAIAALVAVAARGLVLEPFRIPSGSMVPTLEAGDHIFVSKLAYGPRVPFTHHRLWKGSPPRRGDIVVFENPIDPGNEYVKRVVGVPGDVIELKDEQLFVNGVPQPRAPTGETSYEEAPDGVGTGFASVCRRYREVLARGTLVRPEAHGPLGAVARWRSGAAEGVASYEVLQCGLGLAEPEGPFQRVEPEHLFVLGDNRDRSADSRGQGGWQVPYDHVVGKATLVLYRFRRAGEARPVGEGLGLDRLFKRIE